MMKRAMRGGVETDSLVADAWSGTKTMVSVTEGVGVCAGLPWRAVTVEAGLDLSENKTR